MRPPFFKKKFGKEVIDAIAHFKIDLYLLVLTVLGLHREQYHASSGMFSGSTGGSAQRKWNACGHVSQQRSSPPKLQLPQLSLSIGLVLERESSCFHR